MEEIRIFTEMDLFPLAKSCEFGEYFMRANEIFSSKYTRGNGKSLRMILFKNVEMMRERNIFHNFIKIGVLIYALNKSEMSE